MLAAAAAAAAVEGCCCCCCINDIAAGENGEAPEDAEAEERGLWRPATRAAAADEDEGDDARSTPTPGKGEKDSMQVEQKAQFDFLLRDAQRLIISSSITAH